MGQPIENRNDPITFVGTIQQNKAIKSLIILMIILSIAPIVASAVTPDIYVNTTGWWRTGGAFNATSSMQIQAAINNATDGDTIYVYAGTYSENVNVNQRGFILAMVWITPTFLITTHRTTTTPSI